MNYLYELDIILVKNNNIAALHGLFMATKLSVGKIFVRRILMSLMIHNYLNF